MNSRLHITLAEMTWQSVRLRVAMKAVVAMLSPQPSSCRTRYDRLNIMGTAPQTLHAYHGEADDATQLAPAIMDSAL